MYFSDDESAPGPETIGVRLCELLMQFDAAIDQEEGNEDCTDECDDVSNLFWNSDCTER